MPLPLRDVPTMYVRFFREGGHVGLLNVADFDPERHQPVDAPGAEPATPPPSVPADPPATAPRPRRKG